MSKQVKTMRDSNGTDVPLKYVSAYDKLRDKVARRILARFVRARKDLETIVKDCIDDLDTVKQTKEKLGARGNFSTQSFDGLVEVSIRQQYNIMLDSRVSQAREMMLEYIESVLAKVGGNDAAALKLIVEEAFRANADGILPTGKILALLRMEIQNSKWIAAKAILQDAIKPQKGKRYLICAIRKNTQEEFKRIRLDIADCWPEE